MSTPNDEEIFTTWTYDLDEADARVIYLCGELDATSAPAFLSDTRRIAVEGRNVIMDVHLLCYADSTGVAAMLSIANAVEQSGHRLILVGCRGLLSRILHATQASNVLRCCEDIDEAARLLKE